MSAALKYLKLCRSWMTLAFLWVAWGCGQDALDAGPGKGDGNNRTVEVTFGAGVPGATATRSLYDNEYELDHADVLVFHEGFFFEHVQATGLLYEGGRYTFKAALTYSDEPVTIMVVGNVRDLISGHPSLVKGNALQDVIENLTAGFGSYADGTRQYFPLFGQAVLTAVTEDTIVESLKLLRAFSRVEVHVGNNAQDEFELSSLAVYYAADDFRILTDKLNPSANKVTGTSVPAGVAYNTHTYTVTSTDGKVITGVYLPESDEADIDIAPRIVIGGSFRGAATTYYRLDMVKNGAGSEVMRNHNYVVTITSVTGDGYTDPADAADNPSSSVNTDLIEWQDDGTNTIYDKDGKYISLTTRDVVLHFYKKSTRNVAVEKTIGNTFTVQFCDNTGRPQDAQVCKYGESIQNSFFLVKIDAAGQTISVSALTDNPSESDARTQKLLVSIGNIEFMMTVTQHGWGMRDHVHIYNLTDTEGDIGDEVMEENITNPKGNRTILRDILKNEDNYGYEGKVPFAGYKISGRDFRTPVTRYLIELFDVVFVGSQDQSSGAELMIDDNEARVLDVWVNNPNKVLVAYCNNSHLMDRLGITTHQMSNLVNMSHRGYHISTDTPSFITNGHFGSVNLGYTTGPLPYMLYNSVISRVDHPEILPVLSFSPDLNSTAVEYIVIGVDPDRRIVYYNDYFLYDPLAGKLTYRPAEPGVVENDLDRVIANLWGWIAETVLGDEYDHDVN